MLRFGQVGERNIDAIHARNLRPLADGLIISDEERNQYEKLFNADQQQGQVIAKPFKIRAQLQATGEALLEGIRIRDQKAKTECALEELKRREAELPVKVSEQQVAPPTHWELEARRLKAELEEFKRTSLQSNQTISVNHLAAAPSTSSSVPAPLPVLPVSPSTRPTPSTSLIKTNLNPTVSIEKLTPLQVLAKNIKQAEEKTAEKPSVGRGRSRLRETKLAATQKKLQILGLSDSPVKPAPLAIEAAPVPSQSDQDELMQEILLLQ